MTKAELLKHNPRKEFRKDVVAFLAFSLMVMTPLSWMVINQLSK